MNRRTPALYHGTRLELDVGERISPHDGFVYLPPSLDAAIWAAEPALAWRSRAGASRRHGVQRQGREPDAAVPYIEVFSLTLEGR